jgi:CheY-like chemotaxis protein/anti-sigma regulatory factor (Ser/Thr protein kinase)
LGAKVPPEISLPAANKILVVDDEPALLELMVEILQEAGFATTTAGDGVEALEQLGRQAFDLLLTDIRMPRIDGIELLARVRDLPVKPRIVVLTSDEAPETMLKAVREQALHYLTKPVDPARLVEVVREALAGPVPTQPIEVLSARPDWVELSVPCEVAAADLIQGFLARLDADLTVDVRESVGRVFRELLLNAIEWGGHLDPSRRVRISYLRARRMLLYRIADPGPGFRLDELSHAAVNNPPDQPAGHLTARHEKGLRPGGFGLLIAQAMADELLYNEARNEVVFVKYLS